MSPDRRARRMGGLEHRTDSAGSTARRRTPRACKFCKVRKVRCDGKLEGCSQCTDRQQKCVYPTDIPKRRNCTQQLKQENEALLAHIGWLENLIESSGIPIEPFQLSQWSQLASRSSLCPALANHHTSQQASRLALQPGIECPPGPPLFDTAVHGQPLGIPSASMQLTDSNDANHWLVCEEQIVGSDRPFGAEPAWRGGHMMDSHIEASLENGSYREGGGFTIDWSFDRAEMLIIGNTMQMQMQNGPL
ncbi:uncharacterized protein B0I36DRAFT_335022 [Microdochium trichocladiopsis]|uniref:Zn(2)-C6 fungal-type domain-containing protein n=1 Tax=Microdochium trichocladiopsis TaxID=1682393 RepID=A0A9P8XWW7_9PEZI|nr:uncharacterized protein B0I36DRAFT_59198 [Microdochium trichocladiopsis]XP_046007850.1 uncharacterized protein B0I36DRAFT_335022 [Microdochium trichocladiopsis]KAH7009392.1 hypothetical protein B0I36DRAFT_59198 [Microdochium trichocladiopsis]KAH7021649.1 hypothetical protein B0I36DRAFT_335022 [Microdochium trichocladiopsis]